MIYANAAAAYCMQEGVDCTPRGWLDWTIIIVVVVGSIALFWWGER